MKPSFRPPKTIVSAAGKNVSDAETTVLAAQTTISPVSTGLVTDQFRYLTHFYSGTFLFSGRSGSVRGPFGTISDAKFKFSKIFDCDAPRGEARQRGGSCSEV